MITIKRIKSPQKQVHSAQNREYVECNLQCTETENNEFLYINKCRVCLDIGNIPIFGTDGMPDISEDIEIFGNIHIRNNDKFPKYICECCRKLLKAAVLFRKTAEHTDMYLKSRQEHSDNNHTLQLVKSEVEMNSHVDIKADSPIVKEEIIVEPTYFPYFDNNGTEEDSNKNLHTVDDTVSLSVINTDYTCKTCDMNFQNAEEYSQHKKSAEHKKARHSNKIECDICFKNINRAYYNRHMETHSNEKDEKLQCPICNKSYSKTYFNYHITYTHNKDKKKAQSERIQCNVCNKSYEKQYYKFHLAIHSSDSSRYVCDTCGKSFIQQSAFKRHSLIHGSELAFKCTLCPYRGRHPGLVKTHMQTHTKDYQHRCMECPAQFLTKSNLNKHLQRHKGPVDFKCDTCKRGFYSKLELERHFEAYHLGVKNHVCNVCGKAFGYRNAMMSHQLKVHKREKLTNGKGRLPLYLEAEKNVMKVNESNKYK